MKWTRVGATLVAAFAAVAGSMAAVGHFAFIGEPRHFAWSAAVGAGTAAGTTALALVTGLLALATRRSVALEAAIAAESYRPVLIEPERTRRLDYIPETGGGALTVMLRNVGGGPALSVFVEPTYLGPPDESFEVIVMANGTSAIPAGENVDLSFVFAVKPPQTEERITAYGSGAYSFDIRRTSCLDRAMHRHRDALTLFTVEPPS